MSVTVSWDSTFIATELAFSSADGTVRDLNCLFRKSNLSTSSGSRAALSFMIVPPAVEKTCSAGTEVVGELRTR